MGRPAPNHVIVVGQDRKRQALPATRLEARECPVAPCRLTLFFRQML